MTFQNFTFDVDADGIALVTWNMPGRSMNVIDAKVMEELTAIVERVANETGIKGAVLTSGKDAFCAGADLTMLETQSRTFTDLLKSQGEEAANKRLFDEGRKLSVIARRMETCGKPWVAAINGTAMGGGFELALACHHRIASENDKTRLGLPEIKVGLFPGGGGTQRIARMMPPADALQFLLKGDQLRLNRAKAMKLVDEVVPAAELTQKAKDWIKAGGTAKAPWDVDGFKLPGGPVYSKAGMMVFPPANALYRRETYDNYPAARAILQVVYEGLQLPMDQALRVESRYFAKILRSPEAAAMIRSLFVSMQELNKGARRPAEVPAKPIKKIGVLGAGFMGAGIAYVSAQAGIDVVLIDRDQEAADKGKAHSQKLITDQINRGRATGADRDALLAHITATPDYAALADCDLIIEAVFEDRTIKEEVIAKAQAAIGKQTMFGSNTSTLPISSLAKNFKDPGRFVGIHFFSPVDRMMLVEVILGKKTGDAALAAALDYVRAIRKTPIVVNDSRGFYTSRVVGTYIREGHLMLAEGVPAAMIENVGRMAGMPVGPLSLNDEVAVDLAWKILKATEADLGPDAIDVRQKALLEEMVEKRGRYGRKNGKGFYDYPQSGPKRLWPGLADLQTTKLDPDSIDVEELKTRLLAIQALESARCVEEGVVTDMREADVGSILGFGYAPFTGGTISYIDGMGTKAFVELCKELAKHYGSRFKPGRLLRDLWQVPAKRSMAASHRKGARRRRDHLA
jgi:3-hydroxyacyl-CoA dehydrogenase/enoyl-CoA hydratase/3-hydroxybutyryl-CoA epimerase